MNRKHLALTFLVFPILAFSQKVALSHDDYAHWQVTTANVVSDSGIWVTWQTNPQKGDGALHVASKAHHRIYSRGIKQQFSPSERYVFFEQKPKDEERRAAIRSEVPKKERPVNSLLIARLIPNTVDTINRVEDWTSSKIIRDAIAWRVGERSSKNESSDAVESTEDKESSSDKQKKESLPKDVHSLFVRSFFPSITHNLGPAKSYALSRNGDALVYAAYNDSTTKYTLSYFDLTRKQSYVLDSACYNISKVAISTKGFRVAAMHTNDTLDAEDAAFKMVYYEVNPSFRNVVRRRVLIDEVDGFNVHYKSSLDFTHNAKFLFFGVEPVRSKVTIDTNLLDEDKAHVDVWTSFDTELQPRQAVRKSSWFNLQQRVVFRTKDQSTFRFPGNEFSNYTYDLNQSHSRVIHTQDKEYALGRIWTFSRFKSYAVLDLDSEDEVVVHDSSAYGITLSPSGKWAYGYDLVNRQWYTFSIDQSRRFNLGSDIPHPVHNIKIDVPSQYPAFGAAGMDKKESSLWIYDEYDIWQVDLRGKDQSKRLTSGREANVRFRYVKAHDEDLYVDRRSYLHGFHLHNRGNLLCQLKDGAVDTLRQFPESSFYGFKGAKYSKRFVYRTGSFTNYPEIYRLHADGEDVRLSTTNIQIKNYIWGKVEFVDYVVEGDSLRGLLYTPDKFDGDYAPMIVYFYERNADNIFRHIIPTPSRSIINFPYYVSNGYAVFVPDIIYKPSEPGASAYRCIMTGVDTVLAQHSWIDQTRMALNGQSWGGYQSAWLITQTNRFAAAFSGAPVSNMTSAYGGIRWKSGHSRIMQYEEGQSRLGVPMHENIDVYLKNSPVFYTANIKTPLLIMHNDKDGAVPWYQGIELYMSMIRQNKDVWMLVYNNEEHNLTRWANRLDLSIRVSEFYDHYLKGMPAAEWMTRGVPIWKKGKVIRK